jgi:hypothetical protein
MQHTDPIYEFYTNNPFPPPLYDLERTQIVDTVEGFDSRTRDFFQKLWRYDQVVFDTSKANAAHDQ